MKGGVKYILDNPFFTYLKKHYCPSCGRAVSVCEMKRYEDSRKDM